MLKRHLYLIFSVAFFSMILLTSCQKELTFENSGPSGGGSSSSNCKSCNYFPVCNGSAYTYLDTIMGNPSERKATYTVIKDTTIDAKTFVKYTVGDGNFSYYNCTNGESRGIAYNAIGLQGNMVDKLDIIMLKENAPVGANWISSAINQQNQEIQFRDTIVAKNISKTVSAKNFTDVILVKVIAGINLPQPFDFFPFIQTDYYFAKNVGLIEMIATDINSATIIQHTVLKEYKIP